MKHSPFGLLHFFTICVAFSILPQCVFSIPQCEYIACLIKDSLSNWGNSRFIFVIQLKKDDVLTSLSNEEKESLRKEIENCPFDDKQNSFFGLGPIIQTHNSSSSCQIFGPQYSFTIPNSLFGISVFSEGYFSEVPFWMIFEPWLERMLEYHFENGFRILDYSILIGFNIFRPNTKLYKKFIIRIASIALKDGQMYISVFREAFSKAIEPIIPILIIKELIFPSRINQR